MYASSAALRKNSPFTQFLKQAILDATENGQLNVYMLRNSNKFINCPAKEEKGNPLGFSKIVSLFILLLFGALVSLFISMYEYLNRPKIMTYSLKIEKLEFQNSVRNLIRLLEKLNDKVQQIE